jgi:transcriptional regulator with GAF, ATPase, and Fis domain
LTRQYASPFIFEMIYEFERQGLEPIPELSFQQAMMRAIEENNIHLHGVALRLKAHKKLSENKSIASIMADLSKSRKYLEKSGDIIQLSKTLVEIARLKLTKGKKAAARKQAQAAWKVLGGYAVEFFPDDLRYLLDPENHRKDWHETPQGPFQDFIELIDGIFPVHSADEILSRVVMATNRFFGAERGGLFWFPGGKPTKQPVLRASCNLTVSDVSARNFKSNHTLILKAFRENRPILKRKVPIRSSPEGKSVRAVLCLPLEIRGEIRAVVCHDNSYFEDCFDFLDPSTISKVVKHVSRQVTRAYEYFRMREERNDLITEKSIQKDSFSQNELIYQSQIMAELITQVDKVAPSDSTVLILGETGVGKELMAIRVHEMSLRRNKSFIVVDATTIPEGLIESELFGHEKGAFTGADRQKKGRMELAHQGTLFIDEIGELPKSIQVKLLRAIQERSFFRVGGTRTIHSDFRLIAATNRDLAEEVAAKRFRTDLYYRLNVVPFFVPALRDRLEDVSLLANHFLKYYAKKYHRHDLVIDTETELSLKQYDWPGNIRELINIIERTVLLASSGRMEIDLPLNTLKSVQHPFEDAPTLEELEKSYIHYILKKTGGKISGPGGAIEILGLKRSTLYSRMKKLGMR